MYGWFWASGDCLVVYGSQGILRDPEVGHRTASGLDAAELFADVCCRDPADLFGVGDGHFTFGFHSVLSGDLVVVLGSEFDCGGDAGEAGEKKPGRSVGWGFGSFPGKV